ncbi:Mediator of RNA polymerase II transcription subunit 16 [Pleurostoma richardsiae]|uniref:Mediator of RNA polymerase II transcription subunit 16 n=1 Tax=Pleurostoma richardsiae TaxID=41990 RepID=A0AA38R302_9PEZI|nr:Mediator of RNA polymerase II transcription subunit 16 [Pleurostoma richardsiae]
MPLMLDDSMSAMNGAMSVDLEDVDLFGDPVDISIQARPPSKQLQQRMDELRSRGCCQSIAWSKQGTIASIAPDGRSLELRFLRAHPSNGNWDLSQPSQCGTEVFVVPTLADGPIVHLAWASTGSPELAVIDAFGRVCIVTFTVNLNRPYLVRKWDGDAVDDLNTVVGCYWLPLMPQTKGVSKYNVIQGPAVREGNNYRYEQTFCHAFPPFHPNVNKSALLCITASGFMKLFYVQNNNKVEETQLELESITTSDDLVTHASICSDRTFLMMAFATASKQLRVVRANIHWGTPQTDKQVPPGSNPLSPSLKEKHVAVTSWFQHDTSESHLDVSMAQLSHLEVIPSILENSGQPIALPVVLAVRSYVPGLSSPFNHESQSIIDRWEVLDEQPQALHPAFEQLGSRTGSGSAPAVSRLRRLESVVIHKIIISVHTIHYGRVICLTFSDGSVQHRDRQTMNEIYNETDMTRVMMPGQVGFQFQEETPCLQVAYSPTNCSFVQLCEDGKLKWNGLRFPTEEIGSSMQDPQYAAVVAALTVSITTACVQQSNFDDLLAAARPFTEKPRFASDLVMEMVRSLRMSVDYSEEAHHDGLVRNVQMQMCFSVMNHLGFKGEFHPRSFGSKFARLALDVRNIVILITIASNTPLNLKEKLSPLDEPEVVDALAGCAKWALDLLSWLSDCLFNLLDDPKFMSLLHPHRFAEMTAYLQSKNDVSLHLLLCSSTRGFLSASCRRLQHLESLSNRAIQYYENKAAMQNATNPGHAATHTTSTLHNAYIKMQRYTAASLIKVQEFEKLLNVLAGDIRSAYQTSLASLSQRQPQQQGGKPGQNEAAAKRAQMHCELNLMLASSPPNSFLPVINKFFHSELKAFRRSADPARLFFADFGLLEVEDDRRSLAARRAARRHVDIFKRVELAAPGPEQREALRARNDKAGRHPQGFDNESREQPPRLWRRCVRCASVMEDANGTRPGFNFVLAQQRKCSCGGNWGLLPRWSLVS